MKDNAYGNHENRYTMGNNYKLLMDSLLDSILQGDDSQMESFKLLIEELITDKTMYPYKKCVEYKAAGFVTLFAHVAIDADVDSYKVMTMERYHHQKIAGCSHISQVIDASKEAYEHFIAEVKKAAETKTQSLLAKRAKHFIRTNLTSDFHLEDIARYVGVSPTYLSTSFTETEGISLKKYFLEQRILLAKDLLTSTSDSVGVISERLGFCTQSHFTSTFKRLTGMSPLAYRKQYSDTLKEKAVKNK